MIHVALYTRVSGDEPKAVPGWPGYEACKDGTIYSSRNHATGYSPTLLKGVVGRTGYIRQGRTWRHIP